MAQAHDQAMMVSLQNLAESFLLVASNIASLLAAETAISTCEMI
jgi:hypothetical protein